MEPLSAQLAEVRSPLYCVVPILTDGSVQVVGDDVF